MAYIDKELFKQDIKMRYCNNCARPNEIKCRACHIDDMLGEIEDAPTADVAEVRHGEWRPPLGDDGSGWNCGGVVKQILGCSCCGHFYQNAPYNYCPNCGAKMDE